MMLERKHEQRIPAQSLLADETFTKPSAKKSLEMPASHWELTEQPLAVLSPPAKATSLMCGQWHVGMSFICPVICNVINTTLCVQESDIAAIRSFKTTVREQLLTRFKLESDGLAQSMPGAAGLLEPRFKRLRFLPERVRDHAREHLRQLLRDERPDPGPQTPTTDPGPRPQPPATATVTGNVR